MRRTANLVAIGLLAAACGSGVAALEPLARDALPGEPGKVVELDSTSVADDAIDVAGLESLLGDAGFAGGTQRGFAESWGARRQWSLARVLAFADEEGAQTYLDWLEDHVGEVIGTTAELLEPPDFPDVAFLALSEPGNCCPKATNVYLVAWRKGSTVVTLEVGGNGVHEAAVADLAATLDASLAA